MQPLALLLLFQGHAASQKAPTVAKKAMGTRAPSPAPAHLGRVAALGGPSRSPYDGRALNVADDDRSRSSIAPTHGGGHCLPPRRRSHYLLLVGVLPLQEIFIIAPTGRQFEQN